MSQPRTKTVLKFEHWFTEEQFIKEKLLQTLQTLFGEGTFLMAEGEKDGWKIFSTYLQDVGIVLKLRRRMGKLTEALSVIPIIDLQAEISSSQGHFDELVTRFSDVYKRMTLRGGG